MNSLDTHYWRNHQDLTNQRTKKDHHDEEGSQKIIFMIMVREGGGRIIRIKEIEKV